MKLRAPRRSRVALFLAATVAVALAASSASATPNFPGAVQRTLAASSAPDCSVCHVGGRVGRGTVNTPFGSGMRARGLVLYDEGSLVRAITAMEADRVDSDGDGVIDVDAIRMGKTPNPTEAELPDETIPTYGCIGSVAPAAPRSESALALGLLAVGLLAVRRGRAGGSPGLSALLGLCVAGAAVGACASGASLAPRSELRSASLPPKMKPLTATAFEADLRRADLDPAQLPPFESLAPWQVRRVMSTFTRSLGLACTDCHDRQDHAASTRAKVVSVRMWNEMSRGYALEGGGAVFCDSCHQGQGRFLDRSDKKAIASYMSENYTGKLKRLDGKDVECETCHGDPFDGKILAKW